MATSNPSGSNGLQSIFNGLLNRASAGSYVKRLLELCVHYQQQQQDSQNALPSSIGNNFISFNQDAEIKLKALVKALLKSKSTNSIDELERAILHRESRTKCVLLPSSFSNSTTASNCVVDYCRLWRWPDLVDESHLKPVNHCRHAFHYRANQICINPFHYDLVPSTFSVCVPHVLPESNLGRTDHLPPSIVANTMPKNAIYQLPFDDSLIESPASISSQETLVSPGNAINDIEDQLNDSTPMDLDVVPANAQSNGSGTQVTLEEPREWCRLAYYEMSMRVGEQYRATQAQVIIDGFTNPSNAERFCLGSLANVHRQSEVDRIRRAIGPGVKLYHIHGDVFAECLSQNPVFVQSPIANRRQGWEPSTVCKIEPNVRFQIFDLNEFTDVLSVAIREGYESVFNLTKICIIRMSLVKGWGADYARPLVTNTPCWIEIYLDGPLKWIDNILFTMRGPQESINSVS